MRSASLRRRLHLLVVDRGEWDSGALDQLPAGADGQFFERENQQFGDAERTTFGIDFNLDWCFRCEGGGDLLGFRLHTRVVEGGRKTLRKILMTSRRRAEGFDAF